MAESKQAEDGSGQKGRSDAARRAAVARQELARITALTTEAAGHVLERLATRDHRRARWAHDYPTEFYADLLRGLMRLAFSSVARDRLPVACRVDHASRGLRLGQSFQWRELWDLSEAILDHSGSLEPASPAEGLATAYQALIGLRAEIHDDQLVLHPSGSNRRWLGGSYFTPGQVVEKLLDITLEPMLATRQGAQDLLDLRICDPSCGGGAMLVAAARRLAGRMTGSGGAAQVLEHCICGVDVDPVAVELCRFALWMEAPSPCAPWRFLERSIRVGDALVGATPAMVEMLAAGRPRVSMRERCDLACCRAMQLEDEAPPVTPFHWHHEFAEVFSARRSMISHERTRWQGGFDLVIGNPPFLNRLESATAADRAVAAFLRTRFGGIVRCYADAATAFLVLGAQLLRPGGRMALIQPQSLLAARDAGPARRSLAEDCTLEAIWFPTERIFDASVRVCAPVLVRSDERAVALRRFGNGFREYPVRPLDMDQLALAPTWSPMVADLLGVPSVRIVSADHAARAVGDLALVTADFRDQYYGLREAVVEMPLDRPDHPPLVTTGLVDPAHCAWGERGLRFAGRRWLHPRVQLSKLDDEMQRWARSRLRPKILVATQTRTIEAVVDARGDWLPTTPLISVLPRDASQLWRLAAALCSPPLAALAIEHHAGAALSSGAIKLSARQVAALPLPNPSGSWDQAAEAFRVASEAASAAARSEDLEQCASMMCQAYGLEEAETVRLLDWWRKRTVALHGRKRVP